MQMNDRRNYDVTWTTAGATIPINIAVIAERRMYRVKCGALTCARVAAEGNVRFTESPE